ncbi:protein cornichon homolog 4-like isoform X1 [Gossypium arboreum]|uniref:protein cornichon homolog 4-like isoform X1 n=1 Tax=Gossypium arboreum TaxID=29729 RepID=UPI0008194930|nr:protein cornichon homolog 4-like isoform X1 [Gossypium arboreum]
MLDIFIWLISFFIIIAIIVLLIYQLTCLADLEFDYINPYDSSSRINKVVLPEFFVQGFLCLFYLVTGHWFMSLLCTPYLYYNVKVSKNLFDTVNNQKICAQRHASIDIVTCRNNTWSMSRRYLTRLIGRRTDATINSPTWSFSYLSPYSGLSSLH